MRYFLDRSWFSQLPKEQQKLLELSIVLYERERQLASQLTDYSFIIFPVAKAYEGFLKQYLLQIELISQTTFEGRRFRIGRSLNPDVRYDQRDQYWLYDDVARLCGEKLAHDLWEAWLSCRNRIFHYFPLHNVTLTLAEVGDKLGLLDVTMDQAFNCQVKNGFAQPATTGQ
ncbi:MAG: hypothetical protein COY81_03425 [Candidatus Pacebacteria bacterium CG_4_10_14_0_8_um_filter_43_12]|nr:MAG: hypothetical protein COU66_01680 [Candidatus Pacebacteria bacterium CG10_big_fil_rev_8_21_14_0_10_44_11]PIY79302.1 MAG: hypothetical protein COY81_03425 [Candidatus Pacebacteria bacterium CG_4_10_14_0_8_um_filter_43_12]